MIQVTNIGQQCPILAYLGSNGEILSRGIGTHKEKVTLICFQQADPICTILELAIGLALVRSVGSALLDPISDQGRDTVLASTAGWPVLACAA
jgi:hypothetical protein